jgi:hypothetical protein
MPHVEIAHGLSPAQAAAFEERLREARITYLKEAGHHSGCDPLAAPFGEPPWSGAPCVRFRVRRRWVFQARALLTEVLQESCAGST